jgi:lipopolysaccharide export system permease protein
MPITARYLYAQIARPLLTTLGLALAVLVIARMLHVLDLVLGWRGGLGLAVEMLVLLVPHYIGLALPIALYLAIGLSFGRMSRDRELDAYYAAGIGLHQLTRPVFAVAAGLALVTAVTAGYLQPHARYAYNLAVHGLTTATAYGLMRQGAFTTVGGTTVMVGNVGHRARRLERIFIYEDGGPRRSTVTTARRGSIAAAGDDAPGQTTLRLEDGLRQMTEDPLLQGASDWPRTVTMRFRSFAAFLDSDGLAAFRPRGGNERELTLDELWSPPRPLPEGVKRSEVRAELHRRLVHIATGLVVPLLAIPLALHRRRTSRASGLVAGLVTLVAFNEVMQLAKAAIEDELVSPLLGVWTPFAVLTAVGLVLFCRAAFAPPNTGPGDHLGRLLDRASLQARRLMPLRTHRA